MKYEDRTEQDRKDMERMSALLASSEDIGPRVESNDTVGVVRIALTFQPSGETSSVMILHKDVLEDVAQALITAIYPEFSAMMESVLNGVAPPGTTRH